MQDGVGQLTGAERVGRAEAGGGPEQVAEDRLGIEPLPAAVRANDPAWQARRFGHDRVCPLSVVRCILRPHADHAIGSFSPGTSEPKAVD